MAAEPVKQHDQKDAIVPAVQPERERENGSGQRDGSRPNGGGSALLEHQQNQQSQGELKEYVLLSHVQERASKCQVVKRLSLIHI